MKRLHLIVGVAVVVVFLLTGQYMDYLDVRGGAAGDGVRMMYRSRHIYLLGSGLLNIGIGTYFRYHSTRWNALLQRVASVLILVAPLLLVAAFFHEPPLTGLQRHFTLPGIVSMFAGTLLHMVCAARLTDNSSAV